MPTCFCEWTPPKLDTLGEEESGGVGKREAPESSSGGAGCFWSWRSADDGLVWFAIGADVV